MHHRYAYHHRGALGLVACGLPASAAQLTHAESACVLKSAAAGSGRPERPRNRFLSLDTRFRPTLGTVEPRARTHRSNWHCGYPDIHVESSTIGACMVAASAVRPRGGGTKYGCTGNNCSSHLGGPGEPRGATRDPQGRRLRRPDGPDDDGRARRHFPGREKG